MRGFLHRSERNKANLVGLTHFLKRPANARITRQSTLRSKAVMVMVIVRLLLGENHRLRGWQTVKANSPRLKTIPFGVRFFRIADLCKL